MNDPDASTEAERLSLRAGNRLAETQSDRRGQAPGEPGWASAAIGNMTQKIPATATA
jgi:hypothetical protein